jgi:hypothetical protein
MHRKYGSRGVVCISVSVDPLENFDEALGFLKEKGADFPNYWLDEEQEFYIKRMNINGPPAVYVFDRDGRRAAKFDPFVRKYEPKDIDALVEELLKAKP